MKIEFDLKEPSTLRGLVWVVSALVGFTLITLGKDPSTLIPFTAAVVGAIGTLVKDS